MIDRIVRRLKGVFLMLAFVGVGVSAVQQPDLGVVAFMEETGLRAGVLGAVFILSGVMNFIHGWFGTRWNALFFMPFLVYVAFTWMAAINLPAFPWIPVFFYTLLGGYMAIDLGRDLWEEFYARNS